MALIVKKEKADLWATICHASQQILAYQLGGRGMKTAKKLWDNIKHIDCQHYSMDSWSAYQAIIPTEKYIISKAETYTIEAYNALFPH